MSVKLMAEVLESSPRSGTELLVHLILADHANADGVCWPSVGRIAKLARVSPRRAQQILQGLESDGLIVRSVRPGHSSLIKVQGVQPVSGGDEASFTPPLKPASPRTTSEPEGTLAAPRRDEIFEAICEVCGIDWEQLTKDERGRVNAAAKQLRELDVEPGQIRFRARVYRKKYPEAQLTPQALTGNWSQLDNASTPAVSSTAPPEFVPEPEATREEKAKAKKALQGILDQLKGKMVDEA